MPEQLNVVSGKIVFADKRVDPNLADNSIVQYHPKNGESNGQKIWGGVSEGSYTIFTEENGERVLGAPEGDYVVTINPVAPDVTDPKKGPATAPGEKAIPKIYRDPKTTDLTAHVAEGINEAVVLELRP